MAPLGSVGVVVILAIFMLFKRDDLRDRIIGLIGKGHIGETTSAMRDAAKRVNQFLRMNLLVNVCYGIPIGDRPLFHRGSGRRVVGRAGRSCCASSLISGRSSPWRSRSPFPSPSSITGPGRC